jgi:hypothetical protein
VTELRRRVGAWWAGYWFEPAPPQRLDAFARVVFVVAAVHVVWIDHWMADHAEVPEVWYRPVALARLVRLPAPTPTTMALLQVAAVVSVVAALPRRAPRVTASAVFLTHSVWILWGFSYGKVDHDRLTLTVALAVLALTPRRGPDVGGRTGWALRVVQVAFALAYPLSAIVKLRTAGWEWANSAVFSRAIVRRGSSLGEWLLDWPGLLRVGQWAFLAFELFAVVLISRNVWLRRVALVGVVCLHLFTYLMIGISFLPHTICILAFFPLERIGEWWAARRPGPVEAGVRARGPASRSPAGTSATPRP